MLRTIGTGKYMYFEYYEAAEHVGEFVLLSPSDAVNVVELRGFEIYPQYRGKGKSYGMLASVVQEAQTYRFSILSLKVKRDNDPAVRLYTNAGFVVKREDADKAELEMELEI